MAAANNSQTQQTNFAPLPPELCRFRSFASPHSSGSDEAAVYELLTGRLRFKDITTFNDPFEARPQHVAAYDDPGKQRKEMLRYLASIAPAQGTNTVRRRWAENVIRGKTMQQIIDQADAYGGNPKPGEFFVLCLTAPEAATTPLPWSHYADSHHGVCIDFDTSLLPIHLAFPVEYSADYPKVMVPRTAQTAWDGVRRTLLRKCDLWMHEREYRVIRFNLPDAGISYHLNVPWEGEMAIASPTIARAITLGCRMT